MSEQRSHRVSEEIWKEVRLLPTRKKKAPAKKAAKKKAPAKKKTAKKKAPAKKKTAKKKAAPKRKK